MSVAVQCPDCGHAYHVPDHALGKRARCQVCQVRFVLSPPDAFEPSGPPAGERSRSMIWFWIGGTALTAALVLAGLTVLAFKLTRPSPRDTASHGQGDAVADSGAEAPWNGPGPTSTGQVNQTTRSDGQTEAQDRQRTTLSGPEARIPIKEKWKPWREEAGFVESGNQPSGGLTADYLPLVAPFRIRERTFYKDGKEDMFLRQECSFPGNGVVQVQTVLTVTTFMRMDGRGLHRPQEERYQAEYGFIKHGRKQFKDNEFKVEDWIWERALKIGAKQSESWSADPAQRDELRTLEVFGTYHGKPCAVISVGDFGFSILVRGYGEAVRKYFTGDRHLTMSVICR